MDSASVGAEPSLPGPEGQERGQDVQQLHRTDKEAPLRQASSPATTLPQLPPGAGQAAARVIRHSCDMLALPTRVACSALSFLRRVDPEELPPERMAAACVFLAAKVEEASLRTNDMLNAVAAWHLAATCGGSGAAGSCQANGSAARDAPQAGSGSPAVAAAAPAVDPSVAAAALPALASSPCLVGEPYAAAKRQLILDEQLVLRRLRFDLGAGADQPHRHLYVLAHCWGAAAPAVRLATCLLNDAVTHCTAYGGAALPPPTAAAAALHLGCQLAGAELAPDGWWRASGISDGEMQAAVALLLDLVGAP